MEPDEHQSTSIPITSKLAAIENETNGTARLHRALCLDAVTETPGLTAREIERQIGIKAHKRLPELRRCGMVCSGTPRKCNVSGKLAMTWRPNTPSTTKLGECA